MRILVDGDGCPVVSIIETIAEKFHVCVVLFYDTSHVVYSETSEIVTVSEGNDAVDYALISRLKRGDVVVTQDYGVAAMALGKSAYAMNQNGLQYTDENIDRMLLQRHIAKKERRSHHHYGKGPAKRKKENDQTFQKNFEKLLQRILFLEELFALSEDSFQTFQKGLCPEKDNILGIRMPKLKSLARQKSKELDARIQDLCEEAGEKTTEYKEQCCLQVYGEYFRQFRFEYAEETMLYGFVLSYIKCSYKIRMHFLPEYVRHIDSWAVCDSPVAAMKWIAQNKEDFFAFMQKQYMSSSREYELRFVVVVLLNYYVEKVWLTRLFHYFDQLESDFYYVNMAVAWAVSVCYIKYPEETLLYLKQCNLDEFTYRKTLSKITDSYRVSDEQKEIVRKLAKR